jgi:cell division protein FtsQ
MSATANWNTLDTRDKPSVPMDVRFMNIAALVLSGIALFIIGAYAMRWVLAQPVFAVSRIIVDGDTSHHNALTLKANLSGRISGHFFSSDLSQVRGIFESVPWVRRAVVRREFPNRLRVTLEEHRSAGFWGGDGESRMVNIYGEVFEANAGDAETEGLARLVGSEGQSAVVLGMYRQLSLRLAPLDVAIEQLELTAQNAWKMRLDSGANFELGRGTQSEVMARFERFVATHQKVLSAYQRTDLDRIESVDLRNGDGYAIRLSGVTTDAPVAAGKE